MLKGLKRGTRTKTDGILDLLAGQQTAVFILTGSRVFGNVHEESDHDFFCQYTEDTAIWLESIGFEKAYTTGYTDTEICAILRHREAKVDVQMVKDSTLKERVQDLLIQHEGFRRLMVALPRECRGNVWDLAFCIAARRMPDNKSEHFNTFPLIVTEHPVRCKLAWVNA